MITHDTAKGSRSHQEDAYFVAQFIEGTLFGVMDGHGGGAVSALLVDLFPKLWSDVRRNEADPEKIFPEVFKRATELTNYYSEGSTASLAFIPTDESRAVIAVLGDSPVIVERLRGDIWIGPDHNARSNMEERASAILRGGIYDQGYLWHGLDGINGLQLTRALGDVGMGDVLNRIPEVFTVRLGNFLLIGSDGLLDPGHMSKDGTAAVVAELRTEQTAKQMVQRAIDAPTNDNVTAVLWRRE